MQKNPHLLIEGCLIGSIAAGANKGFIFIRGEYETQADILDAAVAEAYESGYLGERILGSGHTFDLVVHRGQGAYICGEETGLLDALEGKRGNPRLKPPFPANQGLYQGPTLINNVETLCNAPLIIDKGADWFRRSARATRPARSSCRCPATSSGPATTRSSSASPCATSSTASPAARPRAARSSAGSPAARRRRCSPRSTSTCPTRSRRWPRRLDARLRRDHRGRRLAAARAAGAAAGRVLPPRVVRQVRALPRGHQLDREDARADRRGRGHADGPRHPRAGPGQHHRQLPVRARRLDGDAGGSMLEALPPRVRAAHGGGARAARPRGAATPIGAGELGRRAARRERPAMARPEQNWITFEIDGREVRAPEGTMLVDAAKHGDVEIPYFCYEPKLGQPVGACRMCLVEIEGIPKLQTSCSTPVRDGMVVNTTSDRVKHAQNAIVEFLLVNHPLDCPVCDKGGECPLQDISYGWGAGPLALHRAQAPLQEAARAVAARGDRPRALHPLLPLRALLAGGRRGLPAGVPRARRPHLRRHARRPPLRGAVQRQHHRALPGGRAHLDAPTASARAPGTSRTPARCARSARPSAT